MKSKRVSIIEFFCVLIRSIGGRFSMGALSAVCLAAVVGCYFCGMAWAISICGSCGYEVGESARFCSHCGDAVSGGLEQDLGARGQDAGDVKDKSGAGELKNKSPKISEGGIAVESVVDDMHLAKKYANLEKYEMGMLFAQNAFAMNLLTEDEAKDGRSNSILEFIKRCESSSQSGRKVCPACKGAGKAMLEAHSVGGRSSKFETAGMSCKRCNASGKVNGRLTMDERKYRLGSALEKYRTLQQSRGMVPEGMVWVPDSKAESLALEQIVAMKRALPAPCSRCMGLGRTDCSTCQGSGVVECKEKGCQNGYTDADSSITRLGGGERKGIRSKCSECQGSGVESCKKCSGSGSFLCKTCNGSGRADICEKCSGKGLSRCKRCVGSGVYRDKPCSYCQKMGSIECSSCGGTGRR